MEFLVDLNKVEDIKTFVRLAGLYDCDIMVKNRSRAFVVDGSSIMAMFSLDLSNPVIVNIDDIEAGESFKNDVWKFVID